MDIADRKIEYISSFKRYEEENDIHIKKSNANDCYFLCDSCRMGARYESMVGRKAEGIVFNVKCPNCHSRMHLWRTHVLYVKKMRFKTKEEDYGDE